MLYNKNEPFLQGQKWLVPMKIASQFMSHQNNSISQPMYSKFHSVGAWNFYVHIILHDTFKISSD